MNERGKGQGFFEALFAELRYAVQDVRQKLVEEGWFGRVVSAKPVIEMHQSPSTPREALYGRDLANPLDRRPSFEEQWAARAPGEKAPAHERPGHDLDR